MNRTACMRAAHQPSLTPSARPKPSEADLLSICGSTAALILAIDEGTTPLNVEFEDPLRSPVTCGDEAAGNRSPSCDATAGIPRPLQRYEGLPVIEHAMRIARESRLAGVALLVSESEEISVPICEIAGRAAHSSGKQAPCVLLFNRAHDGDATEAACGFELFGLTKGVLDQALGFLEQCPQADSLIFLSCDQVRVTPSHVFDVCQAFRDDPTLDAVASWISWLRRTPLLVSRHFLEALDASPLVLPGPNGVDRPLPSLSVREVVFGEEKLAANAAAMPNVKEFFGKLGLSAREAVRIAHNDLQNGRNGAEDEKMSEGSLRSDSDRQLIAIAHATVERLEGTLSSDEQAALDRADTWAKRNCGDFPLLNDRAHEGTLAYLDSAATTQRPFCMVQAQADFDEHENANIYRGAYELSAQATASFNGARAKLEDFIGADRRQTVFTANASASCNLVAQAWGEHNVQAGDLIVTTLSEHHSNMLPWLMLAQRKDAQLAFIPVGNDGRINFDAYRDLLLQRPKLVCMSHISNVLGLLNPVEEAAQAAHEFGARFFLDAAQSLPHIPIDVKALNADFVAFSAHKMYGPLGIGALWISDDAFDEMDPLASGGGSISHVGIDSYYLRQGAIQYEVGTPPVSQAIGWAAAIDYLKRLSMDEVASHGATLTSYLLAGIHGIEGITVWGDHSRADGQTGLVSFSLAGVTPFDLGTACGALGVAIRSGGHCALPLAASIGMTGTGRASFGVHTTREDVEALLVAVEICRHLYRR